MKRSVVLLAAFVIGSLVVPMLGQQQAEQRAPAFEVASVKPNTSGDKAMRIIWPRGRFVATNVRPGQFIEAAYQVESFRLEGGPAWIRSDRFDIIATVVSELPPSPGGLPKPIQLMMQALLVERFRLVTHWERKPQTIYSLVRTRADGPLGPKLKHSDTDCISLMRVAGRGGPLPPPSLCSLRRQPGSLSGAGLPIAQLVTTLTSSLQRTVVDHTGLVGNFTFDLTWMPDAPVGDNASPVNESQPSLFAALQEQLGLKLEPTKGPVDVLVIDHVDKPTPD